MSTTPNQTAVLNSILTKDQRDLYIKYETDLTKTSNYSYVHSRDDAGNIIFKENADNNQLLVIEPVMYEFDNKDINETINTRFSYFKFPATTIAGIESPAYSALDRAIDTTLKESRENLNVSPADQFGLNISDSTAGLISANEAANSLVNTVSTTFSDDNNRSLANIIIESLPGRL